MVGRLQRGFQVVRVGPAGAQLQAQAGLLRLGPHGAQVRLRQRVEVAQVGEVYARQAQLPGQAQVIPGLSRVPACAPHKPAA